MLLGLSGEAEFEEISEKIGELFNSEFKFKELCRDLKLKPGNFAERKSQIEALVNSSGPFSREDQGTDFHIFQNCSLFRNCRDYTDYTLVLQEIEWKCKLLGEIQKHHLFQACKSRDDFLQMLDSLEAKTESEKLISDQFNFSDYGNLKGLDSFRTPNLQFYSSKKNDLITETDQLNLAEEDKPLSTSKFIEFQQEISSLREKLLRKDKELEQ